MGLIEIDGDEEPPAPRESGNVPYPDYMFCKNSMPSRSWWELQEVCSLIDEFQAVDNEVRRASTMVTPTTIADKTSRAIREMTKVLKECSPKKTNTKGLCTTCAGIGHSQKNCPQTFGKELATKADAGNKFFNEKTVELYAMGPCILTIAGMDTGTRYEYLARQLYEMHRNCDESFEEGSMEALQEISGRGRRERHTASPGVEAPLVISHVERWSDSPCNLFSSAYSPGSLLPNYEYDKAKLT